MEEQLIIIKLAKQEGDENPWPFSFSTKFKIENKTNCWISRTNNKTHEIIKK